MINERVKLFPGGGVQIHAPAKLNLGLRVYPKRPDGFHPIESWMVPISLYDTLTIHPAADLKLMLTGRGEGISANLQDNLVGRAALQLAEAAGIRPSGHITLHKVIPAGGGLGGGSSDAAAALLALDALWNLKRPLDELRALALQLGSDVPFFIQATSAVCRGRGEQIKPLPLERWWYAVLFISPRGVPTGAVYESFDRLSAGRESPPLDWLALSRAGANELNATIYNDLASPALTVAPWLGELRDELIRRLSRKIHLSGSGATLFTILEDPRGAADVAQQINEPPNSPCIAVPVRLYRSGEYPRT